MVVLENENITNKIKLVEENLKSQLNLLKLDRNYDDLKDLNSKHDVLNTRIRKIENKLEEKEKVKVLTHSNVKDTQTDINQRTYEESINDVSSIPFTPIQNNEAN